MVATPGQHPSSSAGLGSARLPSFRVAPEHVVDVFVYVTVLNLAIEYLPAVISESFTLSLLTAVLLKLSLEVVLRLQARAVARLRGAMTLRAKLVTLLLSRATVRRLLPGGQDTAGGSDGTDPTAGGVMTSLSIVPLFDADVPFLRAMFYEAAFWRGSADAPPVDVVLGDPALARYVEGWGRPGDLGLLACMGVRPVGA